MKQLFQQGKQVITDNFNELALEVGAMDRNIALTLDAEGAFVMHTALGANGLPVLGVGYDIGIIISVREMSPATTCRCVGQISLPTGYPILLCPHFVYGLPKVFRDKQVIST